MKVLSLFSGVGGFDLGLEQAGMETVFQCEYDKQCLTVLEKHWPQVPRWTDVTTLTGKHILEHAPVIDVIAWGSPCQDLSVAGKRGGLEGSRSGLFHEGMRIIKELRELTNGQYPRISIWENVVGALNSNRGADFGVILDEMAEAGALVIEWAVLDAQHFGVPQRRRRVFVASIFDSATASRCPSPLLPVAQSVRGNTQTRKQTRENATPKTPEGVRTNDTNGDTEPILIDRAAFNQGENALYEPYISDNPVSPSLVARGPHAVATCEQLPYVKSRRTQSVTHPETWIEGNINPTLNSFDVGDVRTTTAIVEEISFYDGYNQKLDSTGVHRSLRSNRDSGDFVAQPTESKTTIRRLTPLECERLMGWPDEHTRWEAGGKEQSDTTRYKQCGNGIASPVAAWIGRQVSGL